MFRGSIPALVTIFRDEAFDEGAFRAFVDWQIEEGSHGLVPCGTTGESATLTAEDTATADSVKAKWPKAKLVSKLKESFAFCQTALGQVNDAALAETITLTFGAQSQQRPRISMLLGHAVDLADHYSQLANYMRLNNILPPTALPRPGRGGN